MHMSHCKVDDLKHDLLNSTIKYFSSEFNPIFKKQTFWIGIIFNSQKNCLSFISDNDTVIGAEFVIINIFCN